MELVLTTNNLTYYKRDGKIFSVWDFSELTEEEIKERIDNWKDYLPDYVSLERCENKVFPMFEINKFDITSKNISLYEYLTLFKEEQAANALKSAFIQVNDDYDCLIIACEPFDGTSDLTDGNMNIIHKKIAELEPELLSLTGKEYIETEVYR